MKPAKHLLLFVAILLFGTLSIAAQEALWQATDVVSPQVNADQTVTFRIVAPKASKVCLTGDFLPQRTVQTPEGEQQVPGVAEMEKQQSGLWTYTTSPLQPELYSYSVLIDGQTALDLSNVYINRDVSTLSNIFIVSHSDGDRGSLYSVNEVAHGNVAHVWYDSQTLGMKRRMTIYTPAGYDRGRRYPVLYLLHGAGGDEEAWMTLGRAAQILDNLIAAGKANPMIVVMPNGNVDCQAAPGQWSRGMYKPDFQSSLSPTKPTATMEESFIDIVKYVESHYRVASGKKHRAVCGLSMGGGHSFAIANRYPQMFDYVGLFSASMRLGGDYQRQHFYEKLTADDDVCRQIDRLFAACPTLYWIGIGRDDFLYDLNKDYRRYLDEKHYPYTYVETDGGHIWRNWRIYLTTFAQLIFKE